MVAPHRRKPDSSEHGIALAIVILVLLLISTIVAGMLIMANSETATGTNFRDEQTAFFAARGGLEEVRDRLRSNSANPITPPTALPGTNSGVLYITNPLGSETVAPWNITGSNYPDTEVCKELTCSGTPSVPAGTPWYTTASAGASYAATPILPWKWARIMAKVNKSDTTTTRITSVDGLTNGYRVCWNGTNEVAVANTYGSCKAANANYYQVYEITTLAVTKPIPPATVGSRRMTQYEITPGAFPTIPGPMIFDGPTPDFTTNPHSAAFSQSGADAAQGPSAGAGCDTPVNQPAIGTSGGTAATSLAGQLNRPGSYTSGAPYTTSPAVADVTSTLGANPSMNLNTVDGLQSFVNMITQAAGNNVFPPGAPTNLGTSAAPAINVVNGDYTLSGGTGIILVTGTLTMNGNPSFNGLILVIGKGNVQKNGGGNGTLNGSLFVANMYTDTSYTTRIASNHNNPPGTPTIAWNGGGNATIQYDSCWIKTVTQTFPLKLVTMRELIY